MKRLLFAGLLAMTSAFSAQAEVSISIGQPGFYGRIDIGGFPQPRFVFPQPVIIQPTSTYHVPVYLHVPPGHAKDWGKHCRHYNACGEPVYFADNDWYEREYVPRYQEQHGNRGHDNDEHNRRDYDRRDDDRKEHRRHEKPQHRKHNGHKRGNNSNWHGNRGNQGSHGNRHGNQGNRGHGRGH